MNYDKSPNETERLSADELKLREMCRALKKTDAPADFDFKLKARIASAKPSDFKPRYGLALRYAMPALALILVFGILAWSGALFPTSNNQAIAESPVAEPNPAPVAPPDTTIASTAATTPEMPNQNSTILPPNQITPKPSEVAAGNKTPKIREIKYSGDARNNSSGGGSEVKSWREAPVLTPRGLDQKTVTPLTPDNEPVNPMPVREVLSVIGVNADLENGKWKVKSVTANSIGESSKIKENDVIESIDDQPLSPGTVFTRTVKGNTLTVTRGGEKIEIKLRGKQ